MSGEVQAQAVVATTQARPTLTPAPFEVQRTCACGGSGSSSVAGHCAECDRRRLTVQRYSLDHVPPTSLLQSFPVPPRPSPREGDRVNATGWAPGRRTGLDYSFGNVRLDCRALHRVQSGVQTKLAISQPGDKHEQEADRAAEQVMSSLQPPAGESKLPAQPGSEAPGPKLNLEFGPQPDVQPMLQRMPEAQQAAVPALEAQAVHVGLIAEDDASELAPGQMRKTEFLDELQRAVRAAADTELAAVGRTAQGCPYIERWIGYYRTRSGSHVERALHRYAPEAAGASTAHEYVPVVTERVRRAASVWAATGQITGVPEELASRLPSADLLRAADSLLSQAPGPESGQVESPSPNTIDDTEMPADDPRHIQADLGEGQSLDTGVRSRMESAFGHDFSRVRVHTDAHAADLSSRLDARAFTVGSDVAFAAGEYQPGTPVGDALLAHELAHVAQQGAASSVGPVQKGEEGYNAIEEDADRSAVGAVASIWFRSKTGLPNTILNPNPHRSGLRLSRCGKSAKTDGPMKTVTIYYANLPGATGSVTSDVEYANSEVYNDQARINVKVGGETKVPENTIKAVLNGNGMLPVGQSASNPSNQLVQLFQTQMPGEINFYYMKGFVFPPTIIMDYIALSYPPFLGHNYVGTLMSKNSTEGTFAHELGHLLLDVPEKVAHNVPTDNLMFQTRYKDANELTVQQVKSMRNSSFVR